MNKQRLTWEKISLELIRPFRIAYGVATVRDTHWIRLEDDIGWGEGVIPSYYQISNAELYACWNRASKSDVPFPVSIHQVQGWIGEDGPGPARCALELALLDRIGRIENKPLYQLLDLPNPKKLVTSYTISISTPQEMAAAARSIKKYPILKIKLGNEEDEACIAAIREVRPDAKIRVDVNGAWDLPTAKKMVRRLAIYDLDLIEQPLPRGQVTELGILQSTTNIPIVADESAQTIDDIHSLGLAGVAGVNLKLMKVGGVLTALEMMRVAQEYNMRIMLGCMIETSIGVTAMAHLSGLAEWIDLDAPLLIKNDPFEGLTYDKHLKISVPTSPGIGVQTRRTK
ncbi:MAG: dipeptide epimerase [Anaerolineaceae bacterium]|nr:dipeptide epimerase [Anaerolineaceae bacterium]